MNDLDLEDIESHLYSQIYHSNERSEEELNNQTVENPKEPTLDMGNPNRFFQKNKRKPKFQNKGVVEYLRCKNPNVQNTNEYLYTKDSGRPFRPLDVPFSQAFFLRKKGNLPEGVKQKPPARRPTFKQNNVNQKPKESPQIDVITLSDSDGESCVEISKNWPILSLIDSEDENKDDKDKSIGVAVNDANTTLNSTPVDTSDDVIFVEPSNVQPETINIDEEVDTSPQKSPDEVSAHADVETASVASSSNSFINAYSLTKSPSTKKTSQERKELLSTPDSASNDFMNNSGIEAEKNDFNFSLHGKDFNKEGFLKEQFVKPTNPSDVCETESSSSTTDPNFLNTMKTVVFNEIEFPKEGIFSEANLETFGNFITPLRKSSVKKTTQNSTPLENMSPSQSHNVYSSDSSSESDFEDTDVESMKGVQKKSKNLPELSPMILENNALQAVKKTKKALNISSKYDIINMNASEITKPVKQKKRKSSQLTETSADNSEGSSSKKKKNKKRKTDGKSLPNVVTEGDKNSTVNTPSVNESTVDENLLNTSVQDSNSGEEVDGESKRKRKKSREVSEEAIEDTDANHSKKKNKTKKRKSFTETESTDEHMNDLDPSVHLQQDSSDKNQDKEDQINKNVESTSAAVESEPAVAHCSKELPLTNCHIRFDKDREANEHPEKNCEQIKKELVSQFPSNLQGPGVKLENENITEPEDQKLDDGKVENVAPNVENVEVKVETTDDVICLGYREEIQVILSSDSESHLSALNEQQDISLVNCEELNTQEKVASVAVSSEKSNVLDLTHCSVTELQQNMSSDPKMWKILDSDRMPPDTNFLSHRRCNKCKEKGHMAVKCPNTVISKCRLCGERGHFEPRCPNRICTQCGSRRPYSTTTCSVCFKYKNRKCELCTMVGHPATACPDLWRRYHMTTMEGPLRYTNGPLLKPKHKLWCSGCARSGHLEFTCRYFKSMYPPSDPRIRSYEDVYQERTSREVQHVGQSLFCTINNIQNANYNMPDPLHEQRYPLYQTNYGMNSYVGNSTFVNNQGNFLEGGTANMTTVQNTALHHDVNTYQIQNQEFFFEDNLPNFISFDAPLTFEINNMEYDNIDLAGRYYESNIETENNAIISDTNQADITVYPTKHNSIFFSSPAETVRHFIVKELQSLFRLSHQINNVVKNLRKKPVNRHLKSEFYTYNKTLNMVLFGIYKLHDGGKHLVKLKKFKAQPLRSRLKQRKRIDLYKSYCYIFGKEKHKGVDYNELLRRI